MKKEQLKIAISINQEIEECGKQIRMIENLLSRPVQQTEWSNDLRNGYIKVPKQLFETVGKLIMSEYMNKLKELEKELENL